MRQGRCSAGRARSRRSTRASAPEGCPSPSSRAKRSDLDAAESRSLRRVAPRDDRETLARAPSRPPVTTTPWTSEVGGITVHGGTAASRASARRARAARSRALVVTDPACAERATPSAPPVARRSWTCRRALRRGEREPDQRRGGPRGRGGAAVRRRPPGGGGRRQCHGHAKGINFIATNGGRMEDYWGFGKAAQPMLPRSPRRPPRALAATHSPTP